MKKVFIVAVMLLFAPTFAIANSADTETITRYRCVSEDGVRMVLRYPNHETAEQMSEIMSRKYNKPYTCTLL
jgi:hypothetical protein